MKKRALSEHRFHHHPDHHNEDDDDGDDKDDKDDVIIIGNYSFYIDKWQRQFT